MIRDKDQPERNEAALLEKVLLLQLYQMGATHGQIARFLGKRNEWVTRQFKHLPKRSSK